MNINGDERQMLSKSEVCTIYAGAIIMLVTKLLMVYIASTIIYNADLRISTEFVLKSVSVVGLMMIDMIAYRCVFDKTLP